MSAEPKFDVSAIGLLIVDILGRHVTHIPENGGILFLDEIRMTVAGTSGATCVDCALLGLSARAVNMVGNDDLGDYLVSKMTRFGINCDLVQRTSEFQTSATFLPIRPDGERPAFHTLGASQGFIVPDSILDAALDARVVHVGGTGLLRSFDGEPTVRLLRRAKELGRVTTYDLIGAGPGTLELVAPCLPFVDYFVPSIEEATALAGGAETDPAKLAAEFKRLGARNVVLTMGEHGAFVSPAEGEGEEAVIPAFKVPVVDTTGCGDSFTAGIIYGVIKGWDLRRSTEFANAVAARVASGLGSDGKLVSFEDTEKLMLEGVKRDD